MFQSLQFYSITIYLHNMSQQQRRLMADTTRLSSQGRQIEREVRSGHVRKSRARDRLTIIPTPLASHPLGSPESRGTALVLASSRLDVPEPILEDSGRPSADDSIDSQEGEYEDYNDQSEETEVDEEEEEEEEEEELEQGGGKEHLSSGWGAQRSIQYRFRETQPLIIAVTPGHTQSSGRANDYPRQRAPVPVRVSQNHFTPAIRSPPPPPWVR